MAPLFAASDLVLSLSGALIALTLAYLVYRSGRGAVFVWLLAASAGLVLATSAWHAILAAAQSGSTFWFEPTVKIGVALVWLALAIALAVQAPRIHRHLHAMRSAETRREELEEAARRATAGETRFRALLEAAPDAMITVARDGRILLVNSQAEALFGYARQELMGQPVEILLPEQLREIHARHRQDYYEQPRRRPMGLGLDLVARCKDGSEFPTEISLSPLQTEDGLAVIVVVRDITERRKAEEARANLVREQAARVEAEAANRAKDEFVAMVSHELRTPLNAMLGWAVMLRSKTLEPAVADRALKAIERNAQAQRQVIDDLLDVSRMITGKISLDVQQVDLAELLEAATESVRPALENKHLRLEVFVESDLPPILADSRRLQQVLWNLLSNAVKFTPELGTIRVSAVSADSHVELQVADTGVGIDSDFLPHAFDRFRQKDSSSTREYGGLGLGLAIVQQLVALHGGTVSAESEGRGKGAVFTVALPVPAVFRYQSRRQRGATVRLSGDVEIPDLRGLRVLVVDDDAETRELLQTVLTAAGAVVTIVASGSEALDELTHSMPDVLMSDIGMPHLDGYDLIRQVRERHLPIPSIALTAYGSVEDRERAVAAGYERHVTKPVLPRDLLTVVATVAHRHA